MTGDRTGPARVQAALARMRDGVLGGRGPGTPGTEVRRCTRARAQVGGEPVAVLRERLAEDTARARRDPDQLALVLAADRARLAADLAALRTAWRARLPRPGRRR